MQPFLQIIAWLIYPLAIPAWGIEGIMRRKRPDWHFSAYNSVFYFTPIIAMATGLCLFSSTWMRFLGLYYIVACYLVALWVTASISAVRPSSIYFYLRLYGARPKQAKPPPHLLTAKSLFASVAAYLYAIYSFAVICSVIFRDDPSSFKGIEPWAGLPTMGTFLYYSVVTIATVGFGDIVPASSLARFATSCHIIVGIFYVVFLFAAFVSYRVSHATTNVA